ncbi:MAG: hypothetical protein H7338_07560 [Candidatus Sericytochromatia bacterium]|nr:hypothetical protein [Candidatus Sericytochromatia bacterium]
MPPFDPATDDSNRSPNRPAKLPYERPTIKFEGHVEALAASCTGRSNKKVGQAVCRIQGAFS